MDSFDALGEEEDEGTDEEVNTEALKALGKITPTNVVSGKRPKKAPSGEKSLSEFCI